MSSSVSLPQASEGFNMSKLAGPARGVARFALSQPVGDLLYEAGRFLWIRLGPADGHEEHCVHDNRRKLIQGALRIAAIAATALTCMGTAMAGVMVAASMGGTLGLQAGLGLVGMALPALALYKIDPKSAYGMFDMMLTRLMWDGLLSNDPLEGLENTLWRGLNFYRLAEPGFDHSSPIDRYAAKLAK